MGQMSREGQCLALADSRQIAHRSLPVLLMLNHLAPHLLLVKKVKIMNDKFDQQYEVVTSLQAPGFGAKRHRNNVSHTRKITENRGQIYTVLQKNPIHPFHFFQQKSKKIN